MRLTVYDTDDTTVRAGYACPCGCTPSVTYERGGAPARSLCCCGNEFVVSPNAEQVLAPREGFKLESETRTAWGRPMSAAWLVGPSVHPEPAAPGGREQGHHHEDDGEVGMVVDPVCGMRVGPGVATEKGLHRRYEDVDYYFCGKGCYLDFGDDPERILDPSYVPTM